MNAQTLSALAITGVGVSLLVQFLKSHFDSVKTQLIVVVLSVLGGVGYFYLQAHTNLLENVIVILATAETIYSYFLQFFEKPAVTTTGTGGA